MPAERAPMRKVREILTARPRRKRTADRGHRRHQPIDTDPALGGLWRWLPPRSDGASLEVNGTADFGRDAVTEGQVPASSRRVRLSARSPYRPQRVGSQGSRHIQECAGKRQKKRQFARSRLSPAQ